MSSVHPAIGEETTATKLASAIPPPPAAALSSYPPAAAPAPTMLDTEERAWLALAQQLSDRLSEKLPAALEGMSGRKLARFAWKGRTASQTSGALEITLDRIQRTTRATSQVTLVFSCKPLVGEAVPVSVMCQWFIGATGHSPTVIIRSDLGSYRQWPVATAGSGGLQINPRFPKPQKVPGYEHIGAVWCGRGTEARGGGVHAGLERNGCPILDEYLREFWPVFSEKEREWRIPFQLCVNGEDRIDIDAAQWAASVIVFALYGILLRSAMDVDGDTSFDALVGDDARGLPKMDMYWPQRPVDLSTSDVQNALNLQGLVIPWHVVEAACAALNSGKHVIFTGPPGCGKSKLAGVLARLATGREALMSTASPAWTSGDLIGRYFPRADGQGLEFRKGFFLDAVSAGNRWLVIDEFNRANIDECFGELFSVLADDAVELPFMDRLDSGDQTEATESQLARVRILPARRRVNTKQDAGVASGCVDYAVSPSFRIIGTMNDADRSALHQLSFALLRRFNLIRVEAPSSKQVADIVKQTTDSSAAELNLEKLAYTLVAKRVKRTSRAQLSLSVILPFLRSLFAQRPEVASSGEAKSARSEHDIPPFTDLVQERVVGIATMQDVIRFVAEGIRGAAERSNEGNPVHADAVGLNEEPDLNFLVRSTCASFLAIAVELCVFPQLDALKHDARLSAVRHIMQVFTPASETLLMMRFEAAEDGQIHLRAVRHQEPTDFDYDHDGLMSIGEFLVRELCQQYRGTSEADLFVDMLKSRAPASVQA